MARHTAKKQMGKARYALIACLFLLCLVAPYILGVSAADAADTSTEAAVQTLVPIGLSNAISLYKTQNPSAQSGGVPLLNGTIG